MVEVTDLLELTSRPDGMRVIIRAERPHLGTQLRITDADGNRVTALAERIAAGRPYSDLADLARRAAIPQPTLDALATAGAFDCFGLDRRGALWRVDAVAHIRGDQLPGTTPGDVTPPALPAMTAIEQTFADLWATGVTPDSHPVQHIREQLDAAGATTAAGLRDIRAGQRVRVGGLVTHRQRPPTAGGVVFINLEDETGMINVIRPAKIFSRNRNTILNSSALLIDGILERSDGATNLIAGRLTQLRVTSAGRSRDLR